jgi:hypothetical protein
VINISDNELTHVFGEWLEGLVGFVVEFLKSCLKIVEIDSFVGR